MLQIFNLQYRGHVILSCQNFKFLVASQVRKANAHHRTKFHHNWSNGCKAIVLTVFKMAVNRHLGFLKFKLSNSWQAMED